MCLTILGAAKANDFLRAKLLFRDFTVEVLSFLHMLSRFFEWLKQIGYIIKSLKTAALAREGRKDTILTCWDKTFGVVMTLASKKKDEKTLAILNQISMIPSFIKDAVAKYYIQ